MQTTAWEVSMPSYEYLCKACNKTFTKSLSMRQHDTESPTCPACGSHDIKQRWSTFSAVTAKKS
jgi:putative FmdB family regulatory protein